MSAQYVFVEDFVRKHACFRIRSDHMKNVTMSLCCGVYSVFVPKCKESSLSLPHKAMIKLFAGVKLLLVKIHLTHGKLWPEVSELVSVVFGLT